MPYPQTETARLAEAHGITYACAKYRLAHGIPLDAPAMPNNNPKGARVWDDQGRTMADIERATGLSRNSIKYRLERGIPLDAPKLSRAEARRRADKARLEKCERGDFVRRGLLERLDEFENVVVASDLCRVRNPFAAMAVRS